MIILKLIRNALLTTILPNVIVWVFIHKLGGTINLAYVWPLTIASMTAYGYLAHRASLAGWQLQSFVTQESGPNYFVPLIALPILLVEFFLMILDNTNFVSYLATFLATLPSVMIHDALGYFSPKFIGIARPPVEHYRPYNKDD